VLNKTFGIVVHLNHDLAAVVGQTVEGYHPRICRPGDIVPRDAGIWGLFGDLCVPLLLDPTDVRAPVQMCVVELSHLLDSFHEMRELLELCPLIVCRPYWDFDFDRLLDV